MMHADYLLLLADAAARQAAENDPRMTEKDFLDTHDALDHALLQDLVPVGMAVLQHDVDALLRELPLIRRHWRAEQERLDREHEARFIHQQIFATLPLQHAA